jgi:hypothetical protein
VISDLGGMSHVLSTFFLILLKPLIGQSFLLNILKLLYTVKIKDETFFGEKSKIFNGQTNSKKKLQRSIYFSMYDLFMMKLANVCCCFKKNCIFKCEKVWPKFKKPNLLIYKGGNKLNKEISIIEIVKTLRKAEIFLNSKYITSEMKEDFIEDEKNFVDLDTTEEDYDALKNRDVG